MQILQNMTQQNHDSKQRPMYSHVKKNKDSSLTKHKVSFWQIFLTFPIVLV